MGVPGRVLLKAGVSQSPSCAPGGFAIFSALRLYARATGRDLVITDIDTPGVHVHGSAHYRGEAVDVRSKNMSEDEKKLFIEFLDRVLGSRQFYYALEKKGEVSEHFHIQVRKGVPFTLPDLLDWTGDVKTV